MKTKNTRKEMIDYLLCVHNTISLIGVLYKGFYSGFYQIAKDLGDHVCEEEILYKVATIAEEHRKSYLRVVQKSLAHIDKDLFVMVSVPIKTILPEIDWLETNVELVKIKEGNEIVIDQEEGREFINLVKASFKKAHEQMKHEHGKGKETDDEG